MQSFCKKMFSLDPRWNLVFGNEVDLPLVTAGKDIAQLANFLRPARISCSAAEVVASLLGEVV